MGNEGEETQSINCTRNGNATQGKTILVEASFLSFAHYAWLYLDGVLVKMHFIAGLCITLFFNDINYHLSMSGQPCY